MCTTCTHTCARAHTHTHTHTHKHIHTQVGDVRPISACHFSPDAKALATSSWAVRKRHR